MEYLLTHITIESILALVTLLGLGYVFVKKNIYSRIKYAYATLLAVPNAMEKFTEIHGVVMRELRTNGGTSLKDSVNELRITVSALDGKFRVYAAHANIIGWESSRDGRCIWASPTMLTLLGRSPEEVLGLAWRSVIAERDRERVIDEWTASVNEARSFYMTYSIIHRSGHLIPILAETHPVRDFKGDIHGYVATVKVLGVSRNGKASSALPESASDSSTDSTQ